jgi:hypothetical protein
MSLAMRRCTAHVCLVSAAALAWVLWHFAPETSGFYPQCPVFYWLHLYCPGCGSTRAMAALLHGRVDEALHYNAMAIAFLPAALAFFGVSYLRAVRAKAFHWPAIPSRVLVLCLAAMGAFTLARNL